ncbi:MAG: hypothetical protein JWN54_2972 [Mycobacterium sp.]|jgi:hypothetical protein|nr:hypothetical protein [Mycobacterium sp.]
MKRHELDVVSLVFGLFFAAVASWWGVNQLGHLNIPLGWPLAAALIVAGLVGLVGALPRRHREDHPTDTADTVHLADPDGTDTPAR